MRTRKEYLVFISYHDVGNYPVGILNEVSGHVTACNDVALSVAHLIQG